MKHKLLIAFIFSAGTLLAQVPGYMGLKFSVKYDCGIMSPDIVGQGSEGHQPNIINNLAIDYTVGRAWSIGLKYGFMTYRPLPNPRYNDLYYTEDLSRYKGRYNSHTLGFVAKKFYKRKGFLAPVGRYILFGAYYQNVNFKTYYLRSVTGGLEDVIVASPYTGTGHMGGVIFGMGRNFVVANRVLIDFGFNLNFPPFLFLGGSDEQRSVYYEAAMRNLLELRLGIGVLAF